MHETEWEGGRVEGKVGARTVGRLKGRGQG